MRFQSIALGTKWCDILDSMGTAERHRYDMVKRQVFNTKKSMTALAIPARLNEHIAPLVNRQWAWETFVARPRAVTTHLAIDAVINRSR